MRFLAEFKKLRPVRINPFTWSDLNDMMIQYQPIEVSCPILVAAIIEWGKCVLITKIRLLRNDHHKMRVLTTKVNQHIS
jgi:hypothetical protein